MPWRWRAGWRMAVTTAAAAASLAAMERADAADPSDPASRVARVMAAYDRTDSPGCTVGVIKDGAFVHLRGYGMANLEHGVPLGPDTVFDIGSTSKQFSAAAIVLLAQAGRLSLDDEVRTHVRELPDYGRPVTIRHLLNHTSGLRDYLELMALAGWNFEDVSTDDDALQVIVRQRELNFEPGAEYLYSNSGFFLLSVIVKRVTGQSLRAFAAERLFRPLGMKDTHFHDDHTEIVPRRATGYSPREGGGFRIDMSFFEQTGDGSVFTTVRDLLQWDRNFYEGTVGGRPLVEQLTTPGKLRDGQPLRYALGLSVDRHQGLARVSHGGSWAGYRAELMRFPEQRLSVACLCNLSTARPSRLATEVAEAYLGPALSPSVAAAAGGNDGAADRGPSPSAELATPSAAELAAYAGRYYSPELDRAYTVEVKDGGLALRGRRLDAALTPTVRDEFAQGAMVVRFERDGQGRPVGFLLGQDRIRNLRFTRSAP
jgi:CubicO group peptidase (beta-lactamase class C family)